MDQKAAAATAVRPCDVVSRPCCHEYALLLPAHACMMLHVSQCLLLAESLQQG